MGDKIFNFVGELIAGIMVAGGMYLFAWWRGDSLPLWAWLVAFLIGDLMWWKSRRMGSHDRR